MSTITIYIAPSTQRPILSALLDLSAAGYLMPFAWWESSADPGSAPDRQNPELLVVNHGRLGRTNLQVLRTQVGLQRIRLVMLVPIGAPQVEALPREAEIYFKELPFTAGVHVHYTRVLIPYGENYDANAIGRPGWHDYMLSPESTQSPEHPAVPWWTAPHQIPGAAGFDLAVYGGILTGMDISPIDNLPVDISDEIIITRHFLREADMSQVETQLKKSVLNIQTPPVPRRLDQGQAIQPFPDSLQWAAYLADKWAEISRPVLLTGREEMPRQRSDRVGAWQILKAFFAFMFTSLLGAPGRWLDRMIIKTKAALAGTVSSIVFGSSSPVSVLVGGVDAKGMPISWVDLSVAAANLRESLHGAGLTRPVNRSRSLASLWTDFHNGICAMLDGTAYNNLGLVAGEYYMSDWSAVIPLDAKASTYTVENNSQYLARGTRVECWQIPQVEAVAQLMDTSLAQEQAGANSRQQEAADFAQWREDNASRFIPRVGAHLAQWGKHLQQEIQFYLQRIEELTQDSPEQDVTYKQNRLAHVMRILVAVLGLSIGVLALIYFFEWLSPMLLLIIGIVWFISWLFGTMLAFYRGQREVFAMLMTRTTGDETLRVCTENLARVLDDMEAVATAHRQLDHWASLMREFLRNPLPVVEVTQTNEDVEVTLPVGMRVEVMTASQSAIDSAAAALRAQIYTQGWVTRAWEAAESVKTIFFTPDQQQLHSHNPFIMEADTGRNSDPLNRWVEGVLADGVSSNYGTVVWDYCRDLIAQAEPNFLTISPTREGLSFQQFVGEFGKTASGSVYREMLKAPARADNKALTDPLARIVHPIENGMSRCVLLMDQTNALEATDFVFSEPQRIPVTPEDPSRSQPGPEVPFRF